MRGCMARHMCLSLINPRFLSRSAMKNNAETLQVLMDELHLSQTRCALVISEITLRPLSARSVRAWLTDPTNPSSRNCPDWALTALLEYKSRPIVWDDEEPMVVEPPSISAHPNDSGKVESAIQKFEGTFPYTFEELDAAFTASMEEEKKQKEDKTRSKLEQIRYRCPQCRLRVFGKADLWVICGECRCALEEND